MAHYIALEQYSVFTPPSNQLFAAQQPVQNAPAEPIAVQESPEAAAPIVVGSASPNYGNYGSNPVKPDDFHKFGETNPSEGEEKQESLVSVYSATPAKSQMYAMRRK
jgi:hypothetical protein